MASHVEAVTFTSSRPEGDIELSGFLHLPDEDERVPGAVLCHPHPSGGGCMDVPLLNTIAGHLAEAGHAALRFNFGGVGASGGMFTDGASEPHDVAAAFAFLQSQPEVDENTVGLLGWSFGSWMAITALAGGLGAPVLSAIAPPLIAYDWEGMAGRLAVSDAVRYYLAGDEDEYCPIDLLEQFAAAVSTEDASRVTILPGANHFLFGREREVASIVANVL